MQACSQAGSFHAVAATDGVLAAAAQGSPNSELRVVMDSRSLDQRGGLASWDGDQEPAAPGHQNVSDLPISRQIRSDVRHGVCSIRPARQRAAASPGRLRAGGRRDRRPLCSMRYPELRVLARGGCRRRPGRAGMASSLTLEPGDRLGFGGPSVAARSTVARCGLS